MKRRISIFAFLLAAIPAFGYNVFVFSSHPTEIADKYGTTGFDVYSQDTHGYSDGWLPTGYTTLVCDESNPLTAAGTDKNKKFMGWYSKNGGWRYNIDDVTVESAADKVSDECALTWTEILEKSGEYGPAGGVQDESCRCQIRFSLQDRGRGCSSRGGYGFGHEHLRGGQVGQADGHARIRVLVQGLE